MSDQNPFLSVDQQIAGDAITCSETMDNLIILCDDFGSRFGGTPGERQAIEFLQTKMKAYGLSHVRAESFEYQGWVRGEVKLEIVSPIQRVVPCFSLPYSPPADLAGTIIDMGDGNPADLIQGADEIKGKVVMTTSVPYPKGSKRRIHRHEKYSYSLMAGATGFIYVNHYPAFGPATGSISITHKPDSGSPAGSIGQRAGEFIPSVALSKEDGAFLQRLIKRTGEVKIRLASSDRYQSMTSWNVIGDLPGRQEPDQIVMLGSHYDGHDISQGAGDPASGAVAVLEAARLLARHATDLRFTVRFALWGVEELGLLGSAAFARAHASEMSNLRFYLDMDGAGSSFNSRDIGLNHWPQLEGLFECWRDQMALDFAIGQSVTAFGDHFPFFLAGAPTGGMRPLERPREGNSYSHTQYDTVDKVELKDMRQAASLAARLALRIANQEDWPVTRRSERTVLELLDGPDLREEEAYRHRLKAFFEQANQSRTS